MAGLTAACNCTAAGSAASLVAESTTAAASLGSTGHNAQTEFPEAYWMAAVHFITWVCPLATCLWVLACLLVRRRRPQLVQVPRGRACLRWLRIEAPGDGLFTAAELGPTRSSTASAVVIAVLVIPWCTFVLCFILGLLLSAVEGWNVDDGIPYLQSGMSLMVGPATLVRPESAAGKAACVVIALLTYVFLNVILGIASALRLVNLVSSTMPRRRSALPLLLLLGAPCVILLLGFSLATLLAASEGQTLHDAFVAVIDYLTTGGAFSVVRLKEYAWHASIFVIQLFFISAVAVGGMIVGIVGRHAHIRDALAFLEGSCDARENDDGELSCTGKSLEALSAEPSSAFAAACVKLQAQRPVPPNRGDQPASDCEAKALAGLEAVLLRAQGALLRAQRALVEARCAAAKLPPRGAGKEEADALQASLDGAELLAAGTEALRKLLQQRGEDLPVCEMIV